MAKEKFDRNKPHVNVGTIGHIDHGKTTLTAAITKVLSKHNPKNSFRSFDSIDQRSGREGSWDHDCHGSRGVRDGEPSLRARRLPGARRLHQEYDYGRGADGRRNSGGGGDGWSDAANARARAACRQVGVPYLVVALNKCDAVDDPELLELVELEVRELLSSYQFPGDKVPVVKLSALGALNGKRSGKSR